MRTWHFVLLSAILSLDLGNTAQVELDGPQLSRIPSSLTHFSNSVGLTLSCLAKGPPPLTITWLGESGGKLSQIPGVREQLPNGSFHFGPFAPEQFIPAVHDGAYRCSVRNPVGTFLSPVFRVRAILDHPFEVTIKTNAEWLQGSPAMLDCEVSPKYYKPFVKTMAWKEIDQYGHEREIHMEEEQYQMSCEGSLVILSAKVEQLFVCIAQNKLNMRTVSSPGFLFKSLRSRPEDGGGSGLSHKSIFSRKVICEDDFSSYRGSMVNREIRRIDLLCLGVGILNPAFRWEKFTSGMSGDKQQKVIQIGSSDPLLQLQYISNNETYRCEVHNAFGSYSANYSTSVSEFISTNITVEPRKVLIKNGQSVEITCKMEKQIGISNSTLSSDFKWFKDGKPLPEGESRVRAASQKLFIFNAQLGDQGVYQCFTEEATATGGTSLLFPSSAPELVHTFISQSLQPGLSLTLKCSAIGNPAPVIFWEVDGQNVSVAGGPNSTPSALTRFWSQSQQSRISSGGGGVVGNESVMFVSYLNISDVQVEHSGAYKCTASNIVDSTSHIARINVFGPIFVKEMGPLTLSHGKTVQIPCHYGGFPVDKVVWEKDSQSIIEMERKQASAPLPRFTVFPNGTLQIGRISEQDRGNYTCRVSNRKGEVATGTVHVNVMRPPVISSFKFDPNLSEGERTSISCNVLSGDLPMSITWSKDGQPLAPNLNISENRVKFISFIIFEELVDMHSGEYTCSASNAADVVKLTAKLKVRVSPKWVKVPEEAKVALNSDHTFSCSAEGVPQPSISWFRETNGIKYELKSNKKYNLGWDGNLTIVGVEEKDSASYVCEAVNGVGNGISKSIRLVVIIPAKISASMQSLAVAEGGMASLQCQVRGDRPVEVIWKRNSTVIQIQSSSFQIAYQRGRRVLQKVVELNESVLSAQLQIEQTEMDDSGVYVCLVSNQYGRDEDRINLQVKARPSPPEKFAVEEIGSRSIRLRWSKPTSISIVPITQYILEWRKGSLAHWNGTLASDGPVFNLSAQFHQTYAVIEGLNPVTNYQVRIFAWNDIGWSLPTGPLTVLTLPEAPSGPPSNVSAIPLGPKSLLVKWEPPEENKQHGAILGYQVITQLQTSSSNNRTVVVDQKWGQQSEVKGLHPNSAYWISVRAYNGAGMGPESSPFFTQTPEGAPDSPPLSLQCEALSPKSLQVQWQPPPAHLSNGQILGYKVIYNPTQVGENRMEEKPEVKKTNNRETTLHGLRSYTSYGVRILAYTSGGESETSKAVNCTTEEDVPDEPADIKVLITGTSSVLVSWLPPQSPNGIVTKYTIFWNSVETSVTREKQFVPLPMTAASSQDHQPSLEIRRLKEGQRYSFWITASTNVGLGKPSKKEVVQLEKSSSPSRINARIASFATNKNVLKGYPVQLPCKVVGSPAPKVSWFKNGISIPSNGISKNGSLMISRVTEMDIGEYTCRAENEHGSDELSHGIFISRPPSIISIFVGYVTESSIQIHWDPPEMVDHPLTAYHLQYRQVKDVSYQEWKSLKLDSLLTSYFLENLLCGNRYELRMLAENLVGRGDFSKVVQARTNGKPPEPAPRLTEIINGNQTMIKIDLNQWPDGGCPLMRFQIDYKKEDGTVEWMKIYRRDNVSKLFIIPTQPEGKYQIRIRVGNDAGSVAKTYFVEAHPDFFVNYAKVLERVNMEERLNRGSSLIPFYTDPHVLVPIVSAVICTAALTVCLLMLIKRKKQAKSGSSWHFNPNTRQQSWLNSSNAHKCGESVSKCETDGSMSVYATLNSTKPIPMTIRDSTVKLQSFHQHENYDAPHPNLINSGPPESGTKYDATRKSRRKSKSSSSPLEDRCIEQIACQMESFPSKIEPPREFRSTTTLTPTQPKHLFPPNHQQKAPTNPYQNSSEEEDNAANEIGRRLKKGFVHEEIFFHDDYSCPYQFETDNIAGKERWPRTLKKKHTANMSKEYFD